MTVMMTSELPVNNDSPRFCAQCGSMLGAAICLVVGHGVRTIYYRCPTCSNEWHHSTPIPDAQWLFRRPNQKP
jgi:hypothetical protein